MPCWYGHCSLLRNKLIPHAGEENRDTKRTRLPYLGIARAKAVSQTGILPAFGARGGVGPWDRVREPFGWWLQGVGIWPSEFLRLLAIVAGVGLLLRGQSKVSISDTEIASGFHLPEPWHIKPMDVVRHPLCPSYWKKGSEQSAERFPSVAELWECYQGRKWHRTHWAADRYGFAGRLAIKVAAIFGTVLGVFIIGGLLNADLPVPPARGHFAQKVDITMIMLAVFTFIVLASYTIDRMVRAIWMVNIMRRDGAAMRFPPAAIRDYYGVKDSGSKVGDDNLAHCHYWLGCNFIGKVTEPIQRLIFYSFVVWILFIFSRSHLFDGWHTPFILYIVFFIYAASIVIPALILRFSAEKFRTDAVSWFNERLIACSGKKDKLKVRQIETIREQISDLKTGAFAPFSQQPLVEAAMALAESISGLMLLEQSVPL